MDNQIRNSNFNLADAIIRQSEKVNSINKTEGTNNQINSGKSFQEILDQQLNNQISFSKHANKRTEERNIQISQSDLTRLGDACDKAQEKGINDALIVMNGSAFIVNASNKTVITVVDNKEMNNNVFTNIDGALFI